MTDHYVLLGASNLTIAAPLVLENLRRNGADADVRVAMGFGRSYGGWSRFLFRELPGIIDCGLWDGPLGSGIRENSAVSRTAAEVSRLPLRGLITDVGNDLLYGHQPELIAGWIEECVRRLQEAGGDVVLTLPPVESVAGLSSWRYSLMRTVFFPFSRSPLSEMRDKAAELHARLSELATICGIVAIDSPGDWYGFDPIHIRRRFRADAWCSILTAWQGTQDWEWVSQASGETHREARNAAPALCRRRGRERTTEQPSIHADGLRVSFY